LQRQIEIINFKFTVNSSYYTQHTIPLRYYKYKLEQFDIIVRLASLHKIKKQVHDQNKKIDVKTTISVESVKIIVVFISSIFVHILWCSYVSSCLINSHVCLCVVFRNYELFIITYFGLFPKQNSRK
jgi:hypothetical protein